MTGTARLEAAPEERRYDTTVAALEDDLLAETRRCAVELVDAIDDLIFELDAGWEPTLATRAALRAALEPGRNAAIGPCCPGLGRNDLAGLPC